MSTPRKHHYVSRVLIDKFFGSGTTISFYDKSKAIYGDKNSSKGIFYEKDLNSTLTETGDIDHTTVESTLNRYFETDFNTHYNTITNCVASGNYEGLTDAIKYIVRLGIIGDMRTPHHMAATQEQIFGTFRMLADNATEELKQSLAYSQQRLVGVKNRIPMDYKEVSDKIIELMGDTIYSVFEAEEQDFFLLPDCTSVVLRAQLEDDTVIDGEVYLNPARPIATVIFPINSKMVLVAQSAKICPQKSHGLYTLSSDTVFDYNKIFFENAYERVVCENRLYLEGFVAKYNRG